MAESGGRKALWPDLTRFGARLSVAHNPSVGRNFLKLAVLDRALFASTSGIAQDEDLLRILRESGFSYFASEVKSGADLAHDAAVGEQLSVKEVERLANVAKRRLYFYSPSISVSVKFMQRIVPAFAESDLRMFDLAEIKHLDHQYISDEAAQAFIRRMQQIDGAQPGVYFTIPRDREAVKAAETLSVPLNVLLEYSDLPPQSAPAVPPLAGPAAEFLAFHPVRAVESAVRLATLGLDGYPLKAPRLSAFSIAYPSYDAAVAANGGDVEGVVREEHPWGLPLAFGYPERRLLVLRDARFLEYSPLRIPDPEVALANAQSNWTFLGQMHAVYARYQALQEAGRLDPQAWQDEATVDEVNREFDWMAGAMRVAMQAFDREAGMVDAATLMRHSGLKPSVFEATFDRGFLHFLTQFRSTLLETAKAKKAAFAAAQPIQPGVRAVLDGVRRRSAKPAPDAQRVDAGEKIGGARKDFAKVALQVDELDGMTAREKADLVKKDHVWPALDYHAMRERGVAPEVAYMIRELRKSFPVSPFKAGMNGSLALIQRRTEKGLAPEQYANYIRAAELICAELAEVRTVEELALACYVIRQKAAVPQRAGYTKWDTDHWFCDGVGYKFLLRALPEITPKASAEGEPLQLELYSFTREVRRARAVVNGQWDWAIKAEREPGAEPEARPKVARPEPVFEHLDAIRRVGPDYRGGQDCSEAAFMERFGLRGIEYGNWLPQGERQIVLNHAFDGFCDLAQALGLPERAMGLGGTLAIAFGARGNGGKNAALAHFEPARQVMNLTRLKGAGSVAHEWFHAFDYWLAQHRGLSELTACSELPHKRLQLGTPEAALNAVASRLFVRDESREEMLTRLSRTTVRVSADEERAVSLTEYFRTKMQFRFSELDRMLPADAQDGAFKAFATALLERSFEPVPSLAPYGISTFGEAQPFVAALKQEFDRHVQAEVPGASHRFGLILNLCSWLRGGVKTMQEADAAFAPGMSKQPSRMVEDARFYDGYRSKPYWSTRIEMIARAFEAYAQDSIEGTGQLSQYLVYGKQERLDAERFVYPRGAERVTAQAFFDAFFTMVRKELAPALTQTPVRATPQSTSDLLEP